MLPNMMHPLCIVLILLGCSFAFANPTNSTAIWPSPAVMQEGTETLSLDPERFVILTPNGFNATSVLTRSVERYLRDIFFPFKDYTIDPSLSNITTLTINVESDDESLQFGVSEAYALTVTSSGANLDAATVWGALRGLETFSQMIIYDPTLETYTVGNTPVDITDYPRYAWRGLLLDSSRHFLPLSAVYRTIDAMAYNKFNTLHWHLTDAQSFPVKTDNYQLLWQRGAWAPKAIYSKSELRTVVQYAYDRGIRIVPEFDMPGHGGGWGKGYPNITTNCPIFERDNPDVVSFNPANNFTFEVIKSVLTEMASIFPDYFMHLGADEVEYGCWEEDEQVSAWMKENGITSYVGVEQYFEDVIQPFAKNELNKTVVVWQDPFLKGVVVPENNYVEIWSLNDVVNVTYQGYNAIWSPAWYLDRQIPDPPSTHYEWVDTWRDFYNAEPTDGVPDYLWSRIVGGEACMWGEAVDGTNIDSRVWPRAAGAGERLWSPMLLQNTTDAAPRLASFRCRLAQRGIGGGPIMPDYCQIPEGSRFF